MKQRRKSRHLALGRDGRPRSFPNYPWAAAGINIARMLGEIFHLIDAIGQSQHFAVRREAFWGVAQSEDSFFALFSRVFLRLDEIWDEEEASYMDFPVIIKRLREELVEELHHGENDDEAYPLWVATDTKPATARQTVSAVRPATPDLISFDDSDGGGAEEEKATPPKFWCGRRDDGHVDFLTSTFDFFAEWGLSDPPHDQVGCRRGWVPPPPTPLL